MSEKKANPPAALAGADRAAVFLMSLGEDEAAKVLQHLGPREVQKIGQSMTRLTNVSRDQVDDVLTEFVTSVSQYTGLGVGNSDYVRKVLVKALGEDKASSVIDRIMMGGSTRGLEQLKWLDGKTIAEMIRLEHPQIMAIILAYLEDDQASEVIAELPERMRHDVLMRVATLEGIQPAALQELDEIMERQFSGKQRLKSSSLGGLQAAANILNNLDTAKETGILEQVQELDAELAERIQELMFVFDDLIEVDDRGMQQLLREVTSDVLVLALKGADEELKAKILSNMSKRAAEMLADDLEAKGPVRLSEVEAAQREILTIAKRLADDGQLMLGGSGESFV
ncbi:flagellar motor switch protein FliG [Alkalilimnicola sp. S0819]|uniref:flagellar motor switch protein FliG n=1 Tax=Alkalilimnicola sp. S0819 TaxID=2613922 RepID=UPI001261EFE9|nr:flagellar motor switch protein FliG [Alkalilimnicola sp. S0819]KAB7627181.1 flagellar motor switch protein FliG [Alkalilimnicola sp. S0819]MPQ15893.1 flagellar motor switch protein FliG [Alkalilimnicola sp. S0819]